MPTPSTFDYAIVRVVPRVERGEFINAGVIVSCAAAGFLQAAIELDEARLLALDPGADLVGIRAALAAIPLVCAGWPGRGAAGCLVGAGALPLAGGTAQHRDPDLAGAHRALRVAPGPARSPHAADGAPAIASPRRTGCAGCHAGLKRSGPFGNSITTVEPSMKRPISSPCRSSTRWSS